ncbi:MAG TPA: LysR family transcriptional regulator [Solirubrobacteraceae bacterium]|nr:LysR family transcriptional regulator [Solirubrobacteraceae bacterium]
MAVTVTQLKAFLAVVRGGSVTAAAEELIVTQPSVSSAIAALGRELGCELLERSGRGIRLTGAGESFAPYASDVIGLLERGRQAAREAAVLSGRRLRIAAVTTAAESFVPPLMRSFAAEHPEVELTLDVGNRQNVLQSVGGHRVDVAITGQPPADPGLLATPLIEHQIVCIVAPDDTAATTSRVPAASLGGRRWLLRESGSGTRELTERFFADHALDPDTLTLGSNGAIKQAARAGLGIALLSRDTADWELRTGRLAEIRLLDGPAPRRWYLLRSAIGPQRPVVEQFADYVQSELGRSGAPDHDTTGMSP